MAELVNEHPLLLELIEHLLVVNTPEPEFVIGILLPDKENVLELALKVPVFVTEQGLPDIVKVAVFAVTVPELDMDDP